MLENKEKSEIRRQWLCSAFIKCRILEHSNLMLLQDLLLRKWDFGKFFMLKALRFLLRGILLKAWLLEWLKSGSDVTPKQIRLWYTCNVHASLPCWTCTDLRLSTTVLAPLILNETLQMSETKYFVHFIQPHLHFSYISNNAFTFLVTFDLASLNAVSLLGQACLCKFWWLPIFQQGTRQL